MPTRVAVDDDEQIIADLQKDMRRLRSRMATASPRGGHDAWTAAATPATTYQLSVIPVQGTCEFAINGHEQREGTDYACDYSTGLVTVSAALSSGDNLVARYLVTDWLVARSLPPDTAAISDSFNRSDSTTTINPCSDGGSWTVDQGIWGIDTNRGYVAAAGAVVENWIRRDVGSNTVDMSLDIFVPSTNDRLCYLDIAGTTGLSRANALWEGYEVAFDGTAGSITVVRVAPSVVSGIGSATVADWRGTTVTWRFVHDGAGNLTLYKAGTAIISGAHDSSGPPCAGTSVVIGLDTTSASHGGGPGVQRIDNFTATPG